MYENTKKGSIFKMKTRNKWLTGSFILSLIFTLGVIYIPALSKLFGLATISLTEFAVAFGFGIFSNSYNRNSKSFPKEKEHKKAYNKIERKYYDNKYINDSYRILFY